MRILTEAEGYPRLGTFDIGLIYKPGRKSPAVEALARHVKEGLQSSRFRSRRNERASEVLSPVLEWIDNLKPSKVSSVLHVFAE